MEIDYQIFESEVEDGEIQREEMLEPSEGSRSGVASPEPDDFDPESFPYVRCRQGIRCVLEVPC